jgi:hypothetical protein
MLDWFGKHITTLAVAFRGHVVNLERPAIRHVARHTIKIAHA